MQSEMSGLLKETFYFLLGVFSGAALTLFLSIAIPILANKF